LINCFLFALSQEERDISFSPWEKAAKEKVLG